MDGIGIATRVGLASLYMYICSSEGFVMLLFLNHSPDCDKKLNFVCKIPLMVLQYVLCGNGNGKGTGTTIANNVATGKYE